MIYFVQQADDPTSPVKIGFSATVWKRVSALQTSSHKVLRILRVIEGDRREEASLHSQFKHVRGEWFEFDPLMLEIGTAVVPISKSSKKSPQGLGPDLLPDYAQRITAGIQNRVGPGKMFRTSEMMGAVGISEATAYLWLKGARVPRGDSLFQLIGWLGPDFLCDIVGHDEIVAAAIGTPLGDKIASFNAAKDSLVAELDAR